jgi:nucleotide-binding universal stress UspA family protein
MYRSILVPLDGSAFGEQALPVAVGIARRAGAALEVVLVRSVSLPASAVPRSDKENPLVAEAYAYLDEAVTRLASGIGVPVTATLWEGSIPDALNEHARTQGVDLVVMTTHGRGGFSRFWLGSVADDLVRRASVPVLLVRPLETAPALTQEPILRHVFIPLDGSSLAEQVLEPAVTLGQLLETDFILLRIVKPVLFAGHDPAVFGDPAMGQPATEQLQAEARTYLEGVAERWRAQSLRVQTRVIVNMQPAVAILEQSLEPPDGVIALATHGRGGLTRALLGSVADKVVRGATMPVLVCRPLPP